MCNGIEQLKKLPRFLSSRRHIAEALNTGLRIDGTRYLLSAQTEIMFIMCMLYKWILKS